MITVVVNELLKVIEVGAKNLSSFSDTEASLVPEPGKWSKKQVIGHLIDSATNNHHRFVRAQQVEEFVFPKYEQEHWVDLQGYNESSWKELVEFWILYNHHLAHVIKRIPEKKLEVICTIGPYEPATLGFLVEEYLVHVKHHLAQIGVI